MKLLESVYTALRALRANKMRSLLTMLGVIIGVGSVILLVSLGSGARAEITSTIQGLGSNLIVVVPFKMELGGSLMQQGAPQFATNKFTLKTIDEIGKVLGNPDNVSGEIQRSMYMSGDGRRFFGMVLGTKSNEFDLRDIKTQAGRYFTKAEEESGRLVIVIGTTVADKLFPGQDPLGQYVTIKGRKVKVIGVQEIKGKTLMFDQDALSWMPITAAIRLFGTSNPNNIVVKSETTDSVMSDAEKIKDLLAKSLSQDEYSVITQSDILTFAQSITKILTYLLGGLAGISLLVGGIGIMNIMLVSVTERTREIGIRKAVGAKTRDIMLQFLVEAVTLSVLGGTIGVLLAIFGSVLYTALFHLKAQVTIWIVLLAFVFSMLVGVFFGVYPARKASRLDPIESLRYE
ncbi:MAG: ABC transporter permease [Candidatus Geothermincolia bacterium]